MEKFKCLRPPKTLKCCYGNSCGEKPKAENLCLTMTLHNQIRVGTSVPSLNFFQFTVTEIQPGQSAMSIFRRTFKFKVTGSRLNPDLTVTLHNQTMVGTRVPSLNFFQLMVTEIQPGQSGSHRPPSQDENNTKLPNAPEEIIDERNISGFILKFYLEYSCIS